MNAPIDVAALQELARALGLTGADGQIRPEWFSDPLGEVQRLLKDEARRAALGEFLDSVIPGPSAAREGWHPLLWDGDDAPELGNLYLLLEDEDIVGVAGELHATEGGLRIQLECRVPLLRCTDSIEAVIASRDFPIEIALDIDFPPDPDAAVELDGIALALRVVLVDAPSVTPVLVLRGFRIGTSRRDHTLDLDDLAGDAVELVVALLQAAMQNAPEPFRSHLLPVLGLGDTGPRLPVLELARDATALSRWLTSFVEDPAGARSWFAHAAALVTGQATLPAVSGSARWDDPLRAVLFAAEPVSVQLTLAVSENRLYPGAAVRVGAASGLALAAELVPLGIPLRGGDPDVLPRATVVVSSMEPLLTGTDVSVRSARAGLDFGGGTPRPLVQLLDVRFRGDSHPVVDLTHLDAVGGLAAEAIEALLRSALGAGPGTRLLALFGLTDVVSQSLDAARLLSDPLAAIAGFHRSVLLDTDPTRPKWSAIFAELAGLIDPAAVVAGSGTEIDPWWFALAPAPAPLSVRAVAWHTGDLTLRVGVVVALEQGPFAVRLRSEVLRVDLPPSGAVELAVFQQHSLDLMLAPPPPVRANAELSIGAARASVGVSWEVGTTPIARARFVDTALRVNTATFGPFTVEFPFPTLDTSSPAALAASLGITGPNAGTLLNDIVRLALAHVVRRFGGDLGLAALSLFGLHNGALGIAADAPLLGANLFDDPLSAVPAWLSALVTRVSSTGQVYWLDWLQLLSAAASDVTGALQAAPSVLGAGTEDDPYRVALDEGRHLEFLFWLEPGTAPAAVAAALAHAHESADALATAALALRGIHPELRAALDSAEGARLSAGVTALAQFFEASDGIVPIASAAPPLAGVTVLPPVGATHVGIVSNAEAIALVRSHAAVPVLLVSASFLDHTCWTPLLAGAPVARFNFRLADTPPDRVDLSGVTALTDWYTADLATGDRAAQAAQVAAALDHLATLHPGRAVTVVAHSTSGQAATLASSLRPGRVAKVVTLATPHLGAEPPYLADVASGAALRVAHSVLSALRGANPTLASAIEEALACVQGSAPSGAIAPLPVALLSAPALPSGAPVVAIAGRLPSGVVEALAVGLRTTAPIAEPPEALGFAIATALDPLAKTGTLSARTVLRWDVARLVFASGTLDTSPSRLHVGIRIERPDGWVLGGPGIQADGRPWPARVRCAEIQATLDPAGLTTSAHLFDAALSGPLRSLGFDDPETPLLLDALMAALAAEPATSKLVGALRELGLLLPDAPRVAADALRALRDDGLDWLEPRLASAIARGTFYGATPEQGWQLPAHNLKLHATAERIRVTAEGEGPFKVKGDLAFDVRDLSVSGEATLDIAGFDVKFRNGRLLIKAGSWLDELELWPTPPAAAVRERFGELVPRLLLSLGADTLLARILPAGMRLPPLDALLLGREAVSLQSLGFNAEGIGFLLQQLNSVLGFPAADGLRIGADLLLTGRQLGEVGVVSLATSAPLGGVLGLDLALRLPGGFAVQPAGTASVTIPGGSWNGVRLEVGASEAGVTLALVVGSGSSATRVAFFPEFSGWASLLSGGVALLPHLLDQIRNAVPSSEGKTRVLAVAQAFDLYDGSSFAARTARFRQLAEQGLAYDAALRTDILEAVVALFGAGSPWTLPGSAFALRSAGTGVSPILEWSFRPSGWSDPLRLVFDWTGEVPAVELGGTMLVEPAAGVRVAIGVDAALRAEPRFTAFVELRQPLGMGVTPRLELGAEAESGTVTPVLRVLPLHAPGTTLADEPLALHLLPEPSLAHAGGETLAVALGLDVLLPLVTFVIERARGTASLWSGGPTLSAIVDASGLFTASSSRQLVATIPPLEQVLANITAVMNASFDIGDLTLTFGNITGDGSAIGVALQGTIAVPIDEIELRLVFGAAPGTDRVELVLFRREASAFMFAPLLRAEHFGLGLAGNEGRPLLSTDAVRLGGVEAHTWFDVDFTSGAANFDGAGLGIEDLGISFGAAAGGQNAVAQGMLSGAASGDSAPPQPGFGIDVSYLQSRGLELRLRGDDPRRAWFGIRAAFGPLYIDQIGIELQSLQNPSWIKILIDGGVTIAGFAAQVDDLAVQIPIRNLDRLDQWGVDLAGLSVAYSGGGVSVIGGLVRQEVPGGIEYAGMLVVKLQSIGLVAAGAWAKLEDEQGKYDSFFVFAGAFFTVSFPPYFELQGIGLGFGFNRALVVPTDMNAVPSFSLLAVLDNPTLLAASPMSALERMKSDLPARRGSLWFAAGIRGALFTVVDVVAVLYVALDSHFEVGLLGIGRLAQPKDSPIVSIELAVKARYSSAEGVLSIQAQLTDNSWLLMPDCQLTGGFALFIWFPRAQFVFTAGGYHPSFVPEPHFPSVPRLGFRCDLYGVIQIKGETYFALTNSCVMAGTRLEAAYDVGWLRAWFEAWADFLLSWDPFHYDISIGIRLGADFNIRINLLFGTIEVHFSISIGASLKIVGPPLHGEVKANLGPIELRVPFGDDAPPKPDALPWSEFRDRYLLSSDPDALPVGVQAEAGLITPASGGTPPNGTSAEPWIFAAEFVLASRTTMPSSKYRGPIGGERSVSGVDLDIAPMYETVVDATHAVTIERRDGSAVALDPDRYRVETRMGDFPEAVYRYTGSETPNAAARNVSALAGLTITALPEVSINRTGAVNVKELVDEGVPKPLPFGRHGAAYRERTREIGLVAQKFARSWSHDDAIQLLRAGSPAHEGLGIRAPAASEHVLTGLRRRVSPPRVAPLSEGMTLEAPGRGLPEIAQVVQLPPVQAPAAKLTYSTRFACASAHAALATTVKAAPGLPRRTPPKPAADAHARLVRLERGIAKTSAALGLSRLSTGPKARAEIERLEHVLLEKGAELAAGVVQTWQLDASGQWTVHVRGDAARIAAFDRGGKPLLDLELASRESSRLKLPSRTQKVVVWSLGRAPKSVAPGFGAVSVASSARAPIAVGWHERTPLYVIDGIRALARGSSLRLSRPSRSGVFAAAEVIGDAATVETRLPGEIGSVLVVTTRERIPESTLASDIAVGSDGTELTSPLRFEDEDGQAVLYGSGSAQPFTVTVTSSAAWRIAGVIGLRGRPDEVAAQLRDRTFAGLLPDIPLSADGKVELRFERGTS